MQGDLRAALDLVELSADMVDRQSEVPNQTSADGMLHLEDIADGQRAARIWVAIAEVDSRAGRAAASRGLLCHPKGV